MTACTVAVDVGNTAVKLAVRQGDSIIDHWIAISCSDWHQRTVEWVRDRLGCKDTHWRIGSVHRGAAQRLMETVDRTAPDAKIDLVTFRDVPMEVAVDSPERLGIDRLLGAYAAYQTWGRSAAAPMVVVDAGSAVTVDWVDAKGCFCGGAILPGLSLQSRALATGTDALPDIQWSDRALQGDVPLPAKNTADAIYAGVLIGVASAIDGLTRRYIDAAAGHWMATASSKMAPGKMGASAMDAVGGKEVAESVPQPDAGSVLLVLTGGDSATLSPYVQYRHHQKSNLVCRGLLNLPHL
ncbi:type III pantothenate kinase [Rubripirellula lacrimiformis]|uniref:type III pantothenate kinase n=1 Tax=Rubripirellula lacrimiformis TaxID=1930273 RepID=UPI001C54F2EB|nr:type III pantothenate kinase [Rubripirellula lacrimiformis]